MTEQFSFPMPGLMSADRAAQIILRGIAAGHVRVSFPWWIAMGARVGVAGWLSLPSGGALGADLASQKRTPRL
jgi:hypothetical protein